MRCARHRLKNEDGKMSCIDGCGESEHGAGFRRYLEKLDAENKLFSVPLELIAAVCLRETEGYRWFNRTDKQYRQNMREWSVAMGKTEEQLLSLIKIPVGPNKGLIPKFRYEPSWRLAAKKMSDTNKETKLLDFVMPVSFGFGQKAMWIYLAGYTPDQWIRLYYAFLNDPYVQLIQVAKDLNELIHETNGNVPLALTRYNGPRKATHISQYGKAVFENYRILVANKQKE